MTYCRHATHPSIASSRASHLAAERRHKEGDTSKQVEVHSLKKSIISFPRTLGSEGSNFQARPPPGAFRAPLVRAALSIEHHGPDFCFVAFFNSTKKQQDPYDAPFWWRLSLLYELYCNPLPCFVFFCVLRGKIVRRSWSTPRKERRLEQSQCPRLASGPRLVRIQ